MNAFVLGVLATLLLHHLPDIFVTASAGFVALLLQVLLCLQKLPCLQTVPRLQKLTLPRDRSCRWSIRLLSVVSLFVAGSAYGVIWGHWRLASIIAPQHEQQDLRLTGVVSGLPRCRRLREQPTCRFEVDVTRITSSENQPLPLRRVLLTTYGGGDIEAGRCVDVVVRLKRPHALFNPGSIDFEVSRLREGIDAVGYVRDVSALLHENHSPLCTQPAQLFVAQLAQQRAGIRQRLLDATHGGAVAGLLLALVLGDYSLVPREQWALFNATGTQHLVTVSGFHIGMAALLGYGLGNVLMLLWRGAGRTRLWVASLCALAAATAYALLAGMSIPVQRSLLMLLFYIVAKLLARESGVFSALRLAFAGIVLANPLAATSLGFWLSFGAVSVLVLGMDWRRRRRTRIDNLLRPQWVVFVGLAPLLLALFAQLPLVSLLANLLAVPWTSIVIMPSIVLCLVTGAQLTLVNAIVTAALEYFCLWLMWCQNLSVPAFALAPDAAHASVFAAALISTVALAPAGFGVRRLLLLLVPVVLLAKATPSSPGGLRLSVFDVGQGLSVLVDSADHFVLFDTGASFGDEIDAAQIAVLPYLASRGVAALDVLMISHADNDHAGGVRSVRDVLGAERLLSGEPVPGLREAQRCIAGQSWRAGEARFDVLYPFKAGGSGNNASCVLLVQYRGRRLLITGDIEAAAERQLLASGVLPSRVDVLVAPHHGSRTSSTAAFVSALDPAHVVFTCGYRNRYRHPHPLVVQRYRAAGSTLYRSDEDGFIQFVVDDRGGLSATRWRQRFKHYWFGHYWFAHDSVAEHAKD